MNAPTVSIKSDCTIGEIAANDYQLVTDSQDTAAIRAHFGNPSELQDFDGFFVWIVDGEYRLVLGFDGIIPYCHKRLYRVEVTA